MKKIAGWFIAAAIVVAVIIFMAVSAGVPKDGGNTTPTATATATPKKTGTLTVEEVIALANAGQIEYRETIRVSGIVTCDFPITPYWYICISDDLSRVEYIIAETSMVSFPELISYPRSSIMTTIEGRYDGTYEINTEVKRYGPAPVFWYIERIK